MLNIPPVPRHLRNESMLRITVNLKLYRDGWMMQHPVTVCVTMHEDWEETCHEAEREAAIACDNQAPRYRACLESFGGWSKA
jgi:hypothetical protein